ncbi:MAG: energy transducer TonB [Proteobacteria bacterium]|nr:energy transducer TonB [Pseudomonadota bacterium]MBU1687704.1 energy transducer TonB [Pseudomonadota bacterium]
MWTASRYRIVVALVLSLAIHGALLALTPAPRGQRGRLPEVRKKVSFTLVARPSLPVPLPREELAPVKPRVTEPLSPQVLPEVRTVVREIPSPQPLRIPPQPVSVATIVPAPPVVPIIGSAQEVVSILKEAETAEAVPGGVAPTEIIREARPLYQHNPPPVYPGKARKRRQQGTVVLEVRVGVDGGVAQIRLHQSSGHDLLDRAAMNAVRDWRFEPGTKNGRAVAMPVLVPVRFELK